MATYGACDVHFWIKHKLSHLRHACDYRLAQCAIDVGSADLTLEVCQI